MSVLTLSMLGKNFRADDNLKYQVFSHFTRKKDLTRNKKNIINLSSAKVQRVKVTV